MDKALSLLQTYLDQGMHIMTAAEQVALKMGLSSTGLLRLIDTYQSINQVHNWSR